MSASKSIWTSRTFWTGVLVVALALAEALPATHWTQAGIGIVIIVLRLVTNRPINFKQKA